MLRINPLTLFQYSYIVVNTFTNYYALTRSFRALFWHHWVLVKWRFFDGVILDLSEIVENILKSKYLRKDFSNKLILHVFSHNKFNAKICYKESNIDHCKSLFVQNCFWDESSFISIVFLFKSLYRNICGLRIMQSKILKAFFLAWQHEQLKNLHLQFASFFMYGKVHL